MSLYPQFKAPVAESPCTRWQAKRIVVGRAGPGYVEIVAKICRIERVKRETVVSRILATSVDVGLGTAIRRCQALPMYIRQRYSEKIQGSHLKVG